MRTQIPIDFFKRRRLVLLAGTTVPLALLSGVMWAQPDANNAGKAGNPNNLRMGGPPGMNMTAEQRVQMQQIQERREARNREENVRMMLIQSGYTDKAVQDAVVAFVNEQSARVAPMKDQIQKVRELLNAQGVTDAQTATALNDLREAAETEKAKRDVAEQTLDAKIGYTKKPKLEALLTVMGIVGQEAGLTSSGGVLGGGMGGPGGGMGGPDGFGGPGGEMGPPPPGGLGGF